MKDLRCRGGVCGWCIAGDGIEVGRQQPDHAERGKGRSGCGIRMGGIGFQRLADEHFTRGVDGIADVEEAGDFAQCIFRPNDDELAAGAGIEAAILTLYRIGRWRWPK